MTTKEFNALNNLWEYITEQRDRSDISEDTYNILQKISDEISNLIYK